MQAPFSPGLTAAPPRLPKRITSLTLSLALASSVLAQDPGSRPKLQPMQPTALPKVLRICAAYCANWRWKDGKYYGDSQDDAHPQMTVESFGPKLLMRRVDPPSRSNPTGLSALYQGRVVEGKGIEGMITFNWQNGNPPMSIPFTGIWTGFDPESRAVIANPANATVAARAKQNEQMNSDAVAGLLLLFLAFAGDDSSDSNVPKTDAEAYNLRHCGNINRSCSARSLDWRPREWHGRTL